MTQHKLCAEFALRDSYGLLAIVDTEEEAVKVGIERDAASFRICEADVATPEDEVSWALIPTTDYSERRYLGVDRTYSFDEVIAQTAKASAALQSSESTSDHVKGEVLGLMAGIFAKHRDTFNEVACIRDPKPYAKEWDFLPLRTGEKVFNKTGVQIWPPTPKP